MIEVIYKDESQEGQNGEEPFGLPRNIRQIGLAAEDYRRNTMVIQCFE